MKSKTLVFVGLVLIVCLCRINGYGQVSEWPMFQRDPQQTGNSTDTSISAPLTQRWNYPAGSLVTSSPTIANGAVYVGTLDGRVHAVDSLNGAFKWVYDSGIGPTLWSAALVSNDKVYIASNGGGTSGVESSYLYILKVNPATTNGELIQKVLLGPRGQHIPSSPVLLNGTIYIGSSGPSQTDNKLWAIDAQTFTIVAPYPITVLDGAAVAATPAVTQNTVVVGTFEGTRVYAFDRLTGTLKWSALVDAPYIFPAPSTANGIVYVRSGGAGHSGDLIAFDENTGTELWRQHVGRVIAQGSPAIAGSAVYTSSDISVSAFDAVTGQSKWVGPAVPGACGGVWINISFFAVANGMIFVKSFNGASGGNGACAFTNVYALNTNDGSLIWDSGLLSTAGIPAGNDYSTPAVADGAVYFGAGQILYAYSPTIQAPGLAVTPISLDFGTVTVGTSQDTTFTVQNTGGGTLTGNATVSAPFSIVGSNSFSLAANQTKLITVRFSPTSAATFNGNVSITSNGGNGSVTLSGTGQAINPVSSVTPTSLTFGNVTVGSLKDLTFTVQNAGGGTLTGNVTTSAPFSIVGDNSFSLAANQTKVITIRFSPTSGATFNGNVSVTSNGGNSSVTLTGTGTTTLPPPVITGLKPNSGPAGTVVTIQGRSFGATQASNFVRFGTTPAVVNSWSNSQIRAVAPSASLGTVAVTVATSSGTSNDAPYTYTEGGKADRCLRTLFRPKHCASLAKLRSENYFNIPKTEISDNQLLDYIDINAANLETLLLQVDYGHDLERFLKGQANSFQNERAFINALGKTKNILTWGQRILDVLRIIGDSTALQAFSSSLGVLSKVFEGISVYKRAVGVYTAFNTRAVLTDYIESRQGGVSMNQAWQDIVSIYGDLLLQISARTKIPIENLDQWFENAFSAYRLVGYPDSASIRYSQGLAIARSALAQ